MMAWNVGRDEEGMREAERRKGLVLLEGGLLGLKIHFESGEFATLINTASTAGNKGQKMKLAGRIVNKTTVSVVDLPIYGIIVTFVQGKAFCKINIRCVIALMENLDITLNEYI